MKFFFNQFTRQFKGSTRIQRFKSFFKSASSTEKFSSMGLLLGGVAIADLYYLYRWVAPPDESAVRYFLDRHYLRMYRDYRSFFQANLFSVWNEFIPYGIRSAHARACDPVQYAFQFLKHDGESEEGTLKFLDLMCRLVEHDALIDCSIKDHSLFSVLLRNAMKLAPLEHISTLIENSACRSPLFLFFQEVLSRKLERTHQLLAQVPQVYEQLEQLGERQTLTTLEIGGFIRSLTHDNEANRLIEKVLLKKAGETFHSPFFPLYDADDSYDDTKKIYFFGSSYIVARWLLRVVRKSLSWKLATFSTVGSITAFYLLHNAHRYINTVITDKVAQSRYWKYTVHATALLHMALLRGCYHILPRAPFILFPFLMSVFIPSDRIILELNLGYEDNNQLYPFLDKQFE